VIRAVERLGLDVERGAGGRMRLLPRHVRRLEAELGVAPTADGLSPSEAKVLAALARAPLGLPSVRAVAERAGLSPTAAGGAIAVLEARGLVLRQRRTVALGAARDIDLIVADVTHPDWARLAPDLARFRPRRRPMAPKERRVPKALQHLFWNTAPEQLDAAEHGGFIARRLLVAGDLDGLAWGAANLSRADWEHAGSARGLKPDRRALARNIAMADLDELPTTLEGADESAPQRRLEPLRKMGGLDVAGVGDILAMKLKVVAERGELRDYFDLMAIETQAGRTVEEGIALFIQRYGRPREAASAEPIVRALGYFDDLDDDLALPVTKDEIADYWTRRQPRLLANLARFGRRSYY
jgi:hypothetical protein